MLGAGVLVMLWGAQVVATAIVSLVRSCARACVCSAFAIPEHQTCPTLVAAQRLRCRRRVLWRRILWCVHRALR